MRKQYKAYLFLFFSLVALLIGLPGTGVVFAKAQAPLASHHKDATLACRGLSIVPSANVGTDFNDLYGVAAVSASDVWAVGDYLSSTGVDQALIEHWNGTSWSVVPSQNFGDSDSFNGVAAVSASDMWAVGTYSNIGGPAQTLIEHWNGTNWGFVGTLNVGSGSNYLVSVAAVPGSSTVWAVGDHTASSNDTDRTLIERYC